MGYQLSSCNSNGCDLPDNYRYFVFTLYGLLYWQSKPTTSISSKALPMNKQILFALTVSLLNPHAILDIVGVIGTSALKYVGTEQILFTVTCITVSWIWFFGLTLAGTVYEKARWHGKLYDYFQ